jgi:uncharacterized DUF497 family protein
MDVVFDPAKDAANIAKMDFQTAAVMIDRRQNYGEVRYRAFNRIAGEGRCLVFTIRNGAIRVISFRRARDKEMRRYGR